MNRPNLSVYSDGRIVLNCRSGNRMVYREDAKDGLDGKDGKPVRWLKSPNDRDMADTDILYSPTGDKKQCPQT